jgi:outer membrane protein TolC
VPNNAALAQQLDSSNSTILAYKQQLEISQLAIKENQRAYSPIVNLRAGYYFSLSNNSAGNVLSNQITGPQIIGSVVIPLYSAGENKRKISVAKMNVQATNYDLENVRLQQNIYLQNALTDFKNQQHLLAIEKENNELTQEFFQISLQRLKLGQTTSLEVHAAQDAYMQSSTRLLNFEYGVKMAEIRLKQLVATY